MRRRRRSRRRGTKVEFRAKDELEPSEKLTSILDDDPELTAVLRVLTPGRQRGTSLAWSPDGSELAVGGMLGDLVVADPSGAREPRVLLRPEEATGLPGAAWIDGETLFGVQWTEAAGEWSAVLWRTTPGEDAAAAVVRLPLGRDHAGRPPGIRATVRADGFSPLEPPSTAPT